MDVAAAVAAAPGCIFFAKQLKIHELSSFDRIWKNDFNFGHSKEPPNTLLLCCHHHLLLDSSFLPKRSTTSSINNASTIPFKVTMMLLNSETNRIFIDLSN